ncbi:hypothetical protein [Pedobacter agri]|uniref:hypothetical protein n=1 Tax=Pedobacter agri TaxID=454586 RepID=UPI0027D9223B|nr:hypothetical protein [Pedobacter agri]
MKKYILNSFFAAVLLFAASCKPEIDTPAGTSAGQANFGKYISVGNSLTAGFADGGLYLEGQKVAYPKFTGSSNGISRRGNIYFSVFCRCTGKRFGIFKSFGFSEW